VAILSGSGAAGFADGASAAARYSFGVGGGFAAGLAFAPNGDLVVSDRGNNRLRVRSAATGAVRVVK
jgi:uncharacterized spore protein YtfJ